MEHKAIQDLQDAYELQVKDVKIAFGMELKKLKDARAEYVNWFNNVERPRLRKLGQHPHRIN